VKDLLEGTAFCGRCTENEIFHHHHHHDSDDDSDDEDGEGDEDGEDNERTRVERCSSFVSVLAWAA